MNNKDKKCKALQGVNCDAVRCKFNSGNGECHAKQISIGYMGASACTDTVCADFMLKSEADANEERK